MFTLRFDMRSPSFGAPTHELYSAALDMCAWADGHGALLAVLSEHHGTEDGHLPSPFLLASAIAGRTEHLPIMLAAIVVPFANVVRLAEDISVLDILSKGRVTYVLGIGHRPEEYEHFGIEWAQRGRLADEGVRLLIELLSGEEVTHEGRSIRITPSPYSTGGPQLFIGGGSLAAARRAGRFGLGLIAQADAPGLRDTYESACRSAGHDPGFVQVPARDRPTAVFVAESVERAWDELGAHLLDDAMTAASYRHGDENVASISTASTVEELRTGITYQIITADEAVDRVRAGDILPLVPLCGGIPPATAWPHLQLAADVVARSAG